MTSLYYVGGGTSLATLLQLTYPVNSLGHTREIVRVFSVEQMLARFLERVEMRQRFLDLVITHYPIEVIGLGGVPHTFGGVAQDLRGLGHGVAA